VYETPEARSTKRGAKRYANVQMAANEWRWRAMQKYRAQKRLREIDDHPMIDMLAKGNELMSGYEAMKLSAIWLITVGEAFWVVERNKFGMPVGYWPIPPWWVLDTPRSDHPYFRMQFPGWNGEVPATEVKWFRDPNPVDPYGRGAGRAHSLGDELDNDSYAARYVKSYFYNSAVPRFGAEVKRRILVGTYVLSHGYYDAYYLKAQQVRRLIADDFQRAFSRCDVLLGPTAPTAAFELGAKTDDPVQMYLNDIFTIAGNLTGTPAISIPGGFSQAGLPIGLQLQANYFEEARLLEVAHRFQEATDFHARAPAEARP
jgi:hypothetical protein